MHTVSALDARFELCRIEVSRNLIQPKRSLLEAVRLQHLLTKALQLGERGGWCARPYSLNL